MPMKIKDIKKNENMYLEASPMTIFSLVSNTPLIPKFYVLIFKIDGEKIRIKNK